MATTQKPILIAGGGPAALLLAQSLLQNNIPFQVFERDESPVFRGQGYRLRLSKEGLEAIEEVLGPEKWKIFWDTCGKTAGSGVTVLDAITAKEVESKPDTAKPKPGAAPEPLASRDNLIVGIARGEMRKVFMDGLESHIKWSHQVTGYEESADGVHVIFADGSKSEEGSMLIGGEGIYSKVAKQVSGGKIKIYDSGSRGIHGQASTTAFKGLGEGVWRLVDDRVPEKHVGIITNVRSGDMDNPKIIFGWTMVAEKGVIEPPGGDHTIIGKPAADMAKDLTKEWHPSLRPLFEEMIEKDAAFWKITCSSPSGVGVWENNPRVTAIGDAAHGMTPAGGNGWNTSARDAALLGRLIKEAGGYAPGVTAAYEKGMREYVNPILKSNYELATKQFGFHIDEANSKTIH